VNPNLNQEKFDSYEGKQLASSRTPLWMAHKSTDATSTDKSSMEQALNEELGLGLYSIARPPYKESGTRNSLVQELLLLEKRSKSGGPTLDETYLPHRMGKEQIIVSNRGCFIIANNYYRKSKNNDDQLILTVKGQKFPFGGKDGVFQYKLKEGDIFSLTKGTETKTFRYENNEIKRIDSEPIS
jgi:hypothetical protein